MKVKRNISSLFSAKSITFHHTPWLYMRELDNEIIDMLDKLQTNEDELKEKCTSRYIRKCTRYLRLIIGMSKSMINIHEKAKRKLADQAKKEERYEAKESEDTQKEKGESEDNRIANVEATDMKEYYKEKVDYSENVLHKFFDSNDKRIIEWITTTILNGLSTLEGNKELYYPIKEFKDLKIEKIQKNSLDKIFRFLNRKIFKEQEDITNEYDNLVNFIESKYKPIESFINLSSYLNKVYPVLKLTNVENSKMPSNSFEIKQFISKLFRRMFKWKWFSKISSYL